MVSCSIQYFIATIKHAEVNEITSFRGDETHGDNPCDNHFGKGVFHDDYGFEILVSLIEDKGFSIK
jgi:hypothetical protein